MNDKLSKVRYKLNIKKNMLSCIAFIVCIELYAIECN